MNEQMERRGRGRPRKERAQARQYIQVTVMLPPSLLQELDAEAEADGLESRSEVLRRASMDYLRRMKKRRTRGADDE